MCKEEIIFEKYINQNTRSNAEITLDRFYGMIRVSNFFIRFEQAMIIENYFSAPLRTL